MIALTPLHFIKKTANRLYRTKNIFIQHLSNTTPLYKIYKGIIENGFKDLILDKKSLKRIF